MKKEKLMARSGAMCKWDGGVLAWTRGACAQPIQPDLRRASRPPLQNLPQRPPGHLYLITRAQRPKGRNAQGFAITDARVDSRRKRREGRRGRIVADTKGTSSDLFMFYQLLIKTLLV